MHIYEMQRRPLDPTSPSSIFDCGADPLKILEWIIGQVDADKPLISNSLFQYDSFATAFQSIGFDGVPVQPDSRINRDCWNPIDAPCDDHPKFFLQWGAKAETSNYCLFEIGDFRKLISLDFRVNKINSAQKIVQLDQIIFISGSDVSVVQCDVQKNYNAIVMIQNNIAQAVRHLANGNTNEAKHFFDAIKWPKHANKLTNKLVIR